MRCACVPSIQNALAQACLWLNSSLTALAILLKQGVQGNAFEACNDPEALVRDLQRFPKTVILSSARDVTVPWCWPALLD